MLKARNKKLLALETSSRSINYKEQKQSQRATWRAMEPESLIPASEIRREKEGILGRREERYHRGRKTR